jgi:hypothetical protein
VSSLEIFFPPDGPTDELDALVSELEERGIETTCRVRPVRRGAEQAVLVVIATTTLQPFLSAFVQQYAPDARGGLRRFVARLSGARTPSAVARTVVMEASGTGAQFVFTPNLPAAAFQQAVAHDPGELPGRWVWDQASERWHRFEDARG